MLAGPFPYAGLGSLASIGDGSTTVVQVVAVDASSFSDGLRPTGVAGGGGSAVVDDFTGSYGDALESHTPTPSGVGSWAKSVGTGSGAAIILDGAGRVVGGTAALSIYVSSPPPASNDQTISWTYTEGSSPSGIGVYGFGVRYDNNYSYDSGVFGLAYSDPTGGTSQWRIVKRQGGSETTIASAAASFVAGGSHDVTLSAIGTAFTLTVDGVVKASAVDSFGAAPDDQYAIYMMPPAAGDATFEGALGGFSLGEPGPSGPYVAGISPEFVTLILGEAFAAFDGGFVAVTMVGPVPIASGDSMAFGAAASLSAAVRGLDASIGFDAASIASALTSRDAAAFTDPRWAVTFAFSSIDAFRGVDAGSTAASVAGSDAASIAEGAAIHAALGAGDSFAEAVAGGWTQFLADVPKSSGDRAAFFDAALILVLIHDSDPTTFGEAGFTATGVTSLDAGGFTASAVAGVAPFPVLDSDSAKAAAEAFELIGSPCDSESWSWLAVAQVVIGVSSLDTFSASESAYIALFVSSCDVFAAFEAAAYTAFTATLNYRVYANDGAGGPIDYNSVVATTADLSWTSGPLPASSDWWYGVRVFSLASGLEERNVDAAVHVIIDSDRVDVTGRPAPPTSLRAVVLAGGVIRVEWSDKRPAGVSRATGYRVYQGAGAVDWTTPVADVPASQAYAGAFFALLGPLDDGTTYAFGVRAYNGDAEEQNGSWTAATADATGPAAVTGFAIGLTSEA